MKDMIIFPVVGAKYSTGGFEAIAKLKDGSILQLKSEPNNQFDPHAIMVYTSGEHIGYVPNQGVSCGLCWTHMEINGTCCNNCGASWDHAVKGGLATRLTQTKSLEKNYACFVLSVNVTDKSMPVQAKLILE